MIRYKSLFFLSGVVVVLPLLSQVIQLDRRENVEEIFLYERLYTSDPQNIDYLLALAQSYSLLEQHKEAIHLYKLGLEREPDHPQIPTRLAYAYLHDQDLVKSERLFREILAKEPNNTDILTGLGLIKKRQNRVDEAEEYFDKAYEIDPRNEAARNHLADIYLSWGNTYVQRGCYCQAIEAYQRGLELKPDNLELKDALAWAYLRVGVQGPHIWTHYQWFWNYPYLFYFTPEEITIRFNWDDIEVGRSLFVEVLEEKPGDESALAGLGRVASLEDNKEEAEDLLNASLSENPDGVALNYLAPLLASEGRYFSALDAYDVLISQDPCDGGLQEDYANLLKRVGPYYTLIGSYSEENEQAPISADKDAWVARLMDTTAGLTVSWAVQDRLRLFGYLLNEYIILKNTLGHFTTYSLDTQRVGVGATYNATPYTSVSGGVGVSLYSQYHSSAFHTDSGWYLQPFLSINYARNHHHGILETFSDAAIVARDFEEEKSTLVDRQFLRGSYEYDFGNRTLIGAAAANVWYINRFKDNQQQIGTAWVQWGPPEIWENLVFRYQFIYGRFNHLTSDYYTYRFQTTHWLNVALSYAWCDDKLITEAGCGHAWQRGFEQRTIIATNPLTPFQLLHREINAAYLRIQFNPTDKMSLSATSTYTHDTFNYTTASITGKLEWLF